jgi:putative redox protein
MTTAGIANSKYRLALNNGRHEFFADEPVEVGGTDSAPAPDELLEAALASCTAITLRMYADRKQWAVQQIDVQVSLERKEGITSFTRNISIKGEVDAEQKDRLLQIAKACPVSKTLAAGSTITTTIQ